VERIVAQTEAQSCGLPVRDLEAVRDDNLVAIMRALKANGQGVGKTLRDVETRLAGAAKP